MIIRKNIDPEIQNLTQELIDNGTHFNLEYLDSIYDDDLKFIRVDKENKIELLTKDDNMKFFKNLKDTRSVPLNTYVEYHYADNDGASGFIILTRRMMQLDVEQEFTFNIQWKKKNGHWKIIRETVYIR